MNRHDNDKGTDSGNRCLSLYFSAIQFIGALAPLLVVILFSRTVAAEENPAAETQKDLSVDEAARELANPNTPMASLTLKSQWWTWDGDLPGAAGDDSGTFLFQPVLPFPLSKMDTIFFRPAFTCLVDQPVVNSQGQIESKSGFGDIGFDLAYGRTSVSGFLAAVGMVSSVPTFSNGLSSRTWTLGPEVLIGYFQKWGVLAIFPSHQWDVTGSNDISLTSIQPIATYLPSGGWAVGTSGILTYDWNAEQWTIPINLQLSKTIKLGKMPWKFTLEINYYIERSDALGPEWMMGFNMTPIVPNVFANLFRKKGT